MGGMAAGWTRVTWRTTSHGLVGPVSRTPIQKNLLGRIFRRSRMCWPDPRTPEPFRRTSNGREDRDDRVVVLRVGLPDVLLEVPVCGQGRPATHRLE